MRLRRLEHWQKERAVEDKNPSVPRVTSSSTSSIVPQGVRSWERKLLRKGRSGTGERPQGVDGDQRIPPQRVAGKA